MVFLHQYLLTDNSLWYNISHGVRGEQRSPPGRRDKHQQQGVLNMADINVFTIGGRVTKDVVLRFTPSGTPTVTFTVAVGNVYYDRNGVKQDETDFIPVTTYGRQAENDAKYLRKGSAVCVSGSIRSWYRASEGRGGFNFEADKVQYMGSPGGGRADAGEGRGEEQGQDGAAADDWVRDFDSADAAGRGGN